MQPNNDCEPAVMRILKLERDQHCALAELPENFQSGGLASDGRTFSYRFFYH